MATETLEKASKAWHAVFTSTSIHAVENAVEAGLAIGVIDRERVTSSIREMGDDDGLPPLPGCQAQLHFAKHIDKSSRLAVGAPADLLRERLVGRTPWWAAR